MVQLAPDRLPEPGSTTRKPASLNGNRGVDATSVEELLSNTYGIRALVDHAWDRTRRVGKGTAGRLDVGVFGSGMLAVVPEILRRSTAAHPDVEVVLLNAPQAAQLRALRRNRLLIAFDRFLRDDSDLVVEVVTREHQVLALHATNPLAALARIPIALPATPTGTPNCAGRTGSNRGSDRRPRTSSAAW